MQSNRHIITDSRNSSGERLIVDKYLDSNIGDSSIKKSNLPGLRIDLPIKMSTECLSHQNSGKDSQLVMRLFKTACLAYKPSDITYRKKTVDRMSMIVLRRTLIDKVSALLTECDLFNQSALYPRRYFDDLMIERGRQEKSNLSLLGIDVPNHHLIVGSPSE